MEALGRVFNVVTIADDVYVHLRDYGAVTFVNHLAAGDTYTLTEASDSSGTGAAALSTITRFHVSATVGAVWTLVTQSVASTMITTASQDVSVLTVSASELSDGMDWIKLTSTSTGLVTAILHDPLVMRNPVNLPAVI